MDYYGAQYGAYGSTPQNVEMGLGQHVPLKKRRPISLKVILVCLIVPWLLFTALYAVVNFELHYAVPVLCGLFMVLGVLVVMGTFIAAAHEVLPYWCHPLVRTSHFWMPFLSPVHAAGGRWLAFLFFSSALAAMSGIFLGDLNYWTNMLPYYELQTLNIYDSVNTATSQGQQMMDAGRVVFAENTTLDLGKAYQFQDLETYCVAPIVTGSGASKLYDFWAVGLNCCGFNASKQMEYKCGPYTSTKANQGLRLMADNQRDFYKLAVQQAEAEYKIVAKHPLLFYWSEDAEADMKSYYSFGLKYFAAGVGAFFCWQIFLILVYSIFESSYEFGK